MSNASDGRPKLEMEKSPDRNRWVLRADDEEVANIEEAGSGALYLCWGPGNRWQWEFVSADETLAFIYSHLFEIIRGENVPTDQSDNSGDQQPSTL